MFPPNLGGQAKATRNANSFLSVMFSSPRSPYYRIRNGYGRCLSSRGEVGGHNLDDRKPNLPHAPKGFQKGLTLVSFASTGLRDCGSGFSSLSLRMYNLAFWNTWTSSICLLVRESSGSITLLGTTPIKVIPRDEARLVVPQKHWRGCPRTRIKRLLSTLSCTTAVFRLIREPTVAISMNIYRTPHEKSFGDVALSML
jgi:hypothetical protein